MTSTEATTLIAGFPLQRARKLPWMHWVFCPVSLHLARSKQAAARACCVCVMWQQRA
jgi:hypothetical protein